MPESAKKKGYFENQEKERSKIEKTEGRQKEEYGK